VRPGPVTVWHPVFIADVTPPDQRNGGMREEGRRPSHHRGARSLRCGPTPRTTAFSFPCATAPCIEMGKDSKANDKLFPAWDQALLRVASGPQAAGLERHEHAPV